MFFIFSKIFWFFINPANIILIILILGWVFLWKKPRLGKRLIGVAILLMFIFSQKFISEVFLKILENRFDRPTITQPVDGIIVLAGMVNINRSREGLIELNSNVERIIEGIALAHKHPEAILYLSGGSGSLMNQKLKEADYLKILAERLGVPSRRIIIERNSRNTYESANAMAKLLKDKTGGKWILVTSAFHMPRAFGAFKKAGLNPIPYPVDYKTTLESKAFSIRLPKVGVGSFNLVLHEWLGLLSYWISGYTNELFPQKNISER